MPQFIVFAYIYTPLVEGKTLGPLLLPGKFAEFFKRMHLTTWTGHYIILEDVHNLQD